MKDLAEMLRNRVTKNARHLAKWAKREGVSCYRLYDRDIPEIPITIDTYEGALVVNDYRIDPFDGTWLDTLAAAAREAAGATELHVKRHRREGQQYAQLDEIGAWRVVHEAGHKLRVNLSDYVDTGLFLDHRITRAKVAAETGDTLLNLFAYTGAFSVHAAAAGKRTTTVDMSRTYLDWASANLELNGLTGELVQSDVREFLTAARRAGRRWDIAIVNPPTFSNSKRMDYTWDVQRNHAALLDDVMAVTAKVVWFSTNRKRFKLEWNGPFADLTHPTTPPDFKHRAHYAFRIVPRNA